MGGLAGAQIPAVMISNPDGTVLKGFLASNPGAARVAIDASLQPVPKPATGGVVAGFSSRGPGSDLNLKPDLVAVGDDVYSAAQNNNPDGVLYSSRQFHYQPGTSFSSPMVAGAAACAAVPQSLAHAGLGQVAAGEHANRDLRQTAARSQRSSTLVPAFWIWVGPWKRRRSSHGEPELRSGKLHVLPNREEDGHRHEPVVIGGRVPRLGGTRCTWSLRLPSAEARSAMSSRVAVRLST